MHKRDGESIKEYFKRLLAMIDRRKRDAEIIREWRGLPKEEEEDPTPKKGGRAFHSPDREE